MKAFYSFFAAVGLMLAATSCSQEAMIENGTSGNDVEVSFNVDMEGPQASRAIGDGTTAKYLYFGAYLKEGNDYNYVSTLQPSNWPAQGRMQFVDKKANIKLRLVKGQTYKFVFWAQSEDGNTYYNVDFAAKKISAVYNVGNTASANNENRDAFYAAEEFTINGPLTETITLKRPFAQVNVGVKIGELAEAKAAGVEITKSSFTFDKVPTELNVLTGVASNEQKVTYHATNIPEADKTDDKGDLKKVENTDYEYIAMNYIFAGGRANVTSTSFTVETDNKVVNTYTVPNLPVERNYRTNIIASIMSDAEFNIVIDPIFTNDIIYPSDSKEELIFAALNGGSVILNGDVLLDSTLIVADNKSLVINLNGYDIINNSTSTDIEKGDGIIVYGDLVIEGEGTVQAKTRAVWARGNYGAKVTIKGGAFIGADANTEVIYASGDGKIDIYGGTFEAKQQSTSFASPQYAVLNLHGNGKDGCDINVYGGKFKNFDPANNVSENPSAGYHNSNFVVEGYSSKPNGEWYEVVKNDEEDNYPDYVDKGTYYEVYKAAGLLKWGYQVNAGDNDLGLKLMRDIVMPAFTIEADAANGTYKFTSTPITVDEEGKPSGSNWVPVGSSEPYYQGKIDGQGHVIKKLRISGEGNYQGFVALLKTEQASIQNLDIEEAFVYTQSGVAVGAFVGNANVGALIENCNLKSSKVTGRDLVGGIVGYNQNTSVNNELTRIFNCSVDGISSITGLGYFRLELHGVGGIAGMNYGSIIRGCTNAGSVSGSQSVGGIAGFTRSYNKNISCYIIDSHNSGSISGTKNLGGVAGYNLHDKSNHGTNSESVIVGCSSTASSISGNSKYKGLIVGYLNAAKIYSSWASSIGNVVLQYNEGDAYVIDGIYSIENNTAVSSEIIAGLNNAMDTYNSNKQQSDVNYCSSQWSWTSGSWPVLVPQE